MTLRKKLVLVACVIPVLLGGCLAGVVLYYYHHPSKIKGLVERSVSASTGTLCVIDDLSYSLKPMGLQAKGIRLEPGEGQRGFILEIPGLTAVVALTGRFGEKSLVLKALKISGFSIHVSGDMALPKTGKEEGSPSLLNRAVRRLSAFFLFREFNVETAQVDNGRFSFESGDQTIHVDRIQAKLTDGHPVHISCAAQVAWPGKKMGFTAPRIQIETDHAISLLFPKIEGIIKVEEAAFESPDVDVKTVAARATCVYEFDRKAVAFHPVDIRLEGTEIKRDMGKGFIPKNFQLTGEGLFDLNRNRVEVPRFSLAGEDLFEVTGSLKAGFAPQDAIQFQGDLDSSLLKNLKLSLDIGQEEADITLQGQDIDLVQSLRALEWLPQGWTFEGLESIEVNASMSGDHEWGVTGQVNLEEISFQSPDAVHMGEGITAIVQTDAVIDLRDSRMMAKTSIGVGGGELLCDRFYVDLRKNGFLGICEGAYDPDKGSVKVSDVQLRLKDVIAVGGSGAVSMGKVPRAALSLKVQETRLKPVFDIFLLEPFRRENPLLSSLLVDGLISAFLELKGTRADWAAKGHCRWVDGFCSSEDRGFSFKGIDFDLPIWLESGKGRPGQGKEKGALSIGSATVPTLPEQTIRFIFEALPNQLVLTSPTNLKIPGGELRVGPVVCRDIKSSERSIETSLTMEQVQIEPLLSGMWAQTVKGTINGKLAPIRFEGDHIRSEGEISAQVFDGQVVLSDFNVSGVFTPGPVVGFSARWDDLSLAGLTSGTAFGKVEGVLRGHVNGVEIAYGQPQAFDLLLETVGKKGVSQKISVKAVENISQLGGGQSPFIGIAGLLASVFDDFPYTKIGIRASLQNDVFRINGTVKEGGTEYLVKRGSISGVNVVNQNPDNRVRFKDMVKRIKRVTAGKSAPVVK